MLIVVFILGTLTLSGALYGLMSGGPRRGATAPVHLLALVLLGVTWWFKHTTPIGRMCLAGGVAAEVVALFLGRSRQGHASDEDLPAGRPRKHIVIDPKAGKSSEVEIADSAAANANPGQPNEDGYLEANWNPREGERLAARARQAGVAPKASQPVEGEDDGPAVGQVFALPKSEAQAGAATDASAAAPVEEEPRLTFRTEVLFRRACSITPSVFLASLRRNGRRDAVHDESRGLPRITAGDVQLDFEIATSPLDVALVEEGLTHGEVPADLVEPIRTHASRLVLTSRYHFGTPRDQIVRLHHHAHAALTEFTPVVAALWPDARLITPVSQLSILLGQSQHNSQLMWRTCVHVRGFALTGDNEGMLLFDSVGLHGFGLMDVQIIAPADRQDAARNTLHLITERFYSAGCDLPNGTEYAAGGGDVWRVTYSRSAFAPDREVVQLAAKGPSA